MQTFASFVSNFSTSAFFFVYKGAFDIAQSFWNATVTWLKCGRYGVKPKTTNKSVSNVSGCTLLRDVKLEGNKP